MNGLVFLLFFNHGDVDGWVCVEVKVLSNLVGGVGGKFHVICYQ